MGLFIALDTMQRPLRVRVEPSKEEKVNRCGLQEVMETRAAPLQWGNSVHAQLI